MNAPATRLLVCAIGAFLFFVALLGAPDPARMASEPAAGVRDPRWAASATLPGATTEDLPNLHRLNDRIFRSAQPNAAGMKALAAAGVRTVVNLRALHDDTDEAAGTGLALEHLPMDAWDEDLDKPLAAFLRVATDPARTPVLVHCQHGADRTGAACAVYRIVVEGWSREDAIAEMKGGGFHYHPVWTNIPEYLRAFDPEKLRKLAGLGAPR